MKADKILQYLDEQFDMDRLGVNPPVLDNTNFLLANARLNVFRSIQHWAILFETVTTDRSSGVGGDMSLSFYAYGNCLQDANAFSEAGLMEAESRALFAWAEDDEVLSRCQFSILLNGKRHAFTPTLQDYESARITFDNLRQGPDDLDSKQLVRFLCHHLNHPFFASEDYLHSLLDKYRLEPEQGEKLFSSHTMTLFLQTRHWQHNDGLPPKQMHVKI